MRRVPQPLTRRRTSATTTWSSTDTGSTRTMTYSRKICGNIGSVMTSSVRLWTTTSPYGTRRTTPLCTVGVWCLSLISGLDIQARGHGFCGNDVQFFCVRRRDARECFPVSLCCKGLSLLLMSPRIRRGADCLTNRTQSH